MKTNASRYVLVAEILIIVLFHAVKIQQSETSTIGTAIAHFKESLPRYKKAVENKSGIEYMLVNIIK